MKEKRKKFTNYLWRPLLRLAEWEMTFFALNKIKFTRADSWACTRNTVCHTRFDTTGLRA